MDVRLPDVVRARALQLGAAGAEWVAGLDAAMAELAQRWRLDLLEQLAGGTAAVVLRARDGAGRDVVLKLGVPDPDQALQIDTLVRAHGRGYARVLATDPDRSAVLLEALGPSLSQSGRPPEDQLRVLCDVLRECWTVPPAAGQRPLDKAGHLHELVSRLWRELSEPCPRAAVDRALACATNRAADPPDRWVVLHGDAAAANCLQVRASRPGAPADHVFVDPDGFLGDPTYDLGVALRDWSDHLLAGDAVGLLRRWCRLVAGRTGLDATAIEEWAYLERVSTGLFALDLGAEALARPLLRSAEMLSASAA